MPILSQRTTLPWPLSGNARIVWYSPGRSAWILGNHADKVVLSIDGKTSPLVTHADAYAQKTTAYDSQLSLADDTDLRTAITGGFHLLTRTEYDTAFAGKSFGSTCLVDQALGPAGLTGGLSVPVRHPGSGAILSTNGKTLTLHGLTPAGLTNLAQIKFRAPLTAILADTTANRILYGTNAGHLIAVPLTAETFGKQKNLATFERVVTSIASSPNRLYVGGMGYIAELSNDAIATQHALSCRAVHVLNEQWLVLNQGMHGLRLINIANNGFTPDASITPPEPIDALIPSSDTRFVLALTKHPDALRVYEIKWT